MTPASHSSQPDPIWVLDIDGTLMPSQHIDNQCYWQAVFEHFGQEPQTLDLHDFAHVTDGSILQEWMLANHGREATPEEVSRIRQRFLDLITRAHEVSPGAFAASPGLNEWLGERLGTFGNCVAIATGGWGHTARFKLSVAGLDVYNLPLASSDDGDSRQAIMQQALRLLLANSGCTANTDDSPPVCYIGDGVWDWQAARQLGWDFIGIACGEQACRLKQAGAKHVFCNFAELAASKPLSASGRKHTLHASNR